MMTRAEHLAWCKKRALEYVDAGELNNAITSMLSDMEKHPETKGVNPNLAMAGILFHNKSREDARRFIEGFN